MVLKRWPVLVGLAAFAGVAYAATTVTIGINSPIALSTGGNGDKPKIQRNGSGLLVTAYGDSASGAQLVYDTKADAERLARDIYVRTCDSLNANCDDPANWSAPVNVSKSADKSSMSSAWRGPGAGLLPYYGDTDKANIKTSGSVMVLTWVGNYCPDGDLQTAGVQAPAQRAVRYLERESRVIPFACTWMAYSKNGGASWSLPVQLSNGERDAKQDASGGTFDSVTRTGRINFSWQEDPRGLQLGEADGPGDGASGANVTNGTDVWYTYADVNLTLTNDPATPADEQFVLAAPSADPRMARALGVRITDNYTSDGIGGTDEANPVFDGTGAQVDKNTIESGQAGAARPNIGMVGPTAIIAYEETKGSEGLDEGKFIRYHAFAYNKPTPIVGDAASNNVAGCIISDPLKNARRVRFLTQSAADATGVAAPAVPNRSGVNIAIFWKEGIYDKGGPSDIVVRRGMVNPTAASNLQSGLAASRMVPAVDPACATSDYATAIGLGNAMAENISSRASAVTAADNGLTDSTELNFTENALAHRGVLRGDDLWIGYSYTADLVKLWAQLDNYNFWVRKFTFDGTNGSWDLPRNLTNITDTKINVREPRFFGTPASNTNAGFCDNADPALASRPEFCQDRNTIFVAWGTQTNVSPFDPVGGEDLGIWITTSIDAGATYLPAVQYSVAQGTLFQDEESAFEAQIVARPDGRAFYGMWNQAEINTGITKAEYASGTVTVTTTTDPVTPPTSGGDGGGCTMSTGKAPFDPSLLLLAALGLGGIALRRVRRQG